MPEKDLSVPLLATNPVTLKIQAHEWGAIESESSNEATNPPSDFRDRYERYARMLQEASIPAGNVSAKWGTEPPPPAGWPLRPGALRCWASCCAFLETSMNVVALFLLIRRRNWPSVLFLAPTHIFVMTMESYLAYNDRAITEKRLEHRSTGAIWHVLLFDMAVILFLGCLHGYALLRARQWWKDKPGANVILPEVGMHGFLYEVEAHAAAAGNFDSPASRLDSHYMFLSGVPRVVVLTNRLNRQYYSTLEVVVFAATAFLSLLNVVHAVVHFDFWASRHIRRQYKLSHSFRFPVAHCIYRLSEVACRLLVLVAAGAVASKAPRVMIAGILIDAMLGVLAVHMVSTMSPKVMILSIPLLVLDVSRYIDEHGFAWPAMRLSRLIGVLRNTEFMAALLVYWTYAREPEDLGPLEGSGAMVLGLLMLLARSTCFVLELTRVGQAGMDLFTATLRGDAAAVESFLQQDCDPNTRQGDALQQGALHVSAAHGHLECAAILLQNGADPDMPDARGDNPLHIACRRGDLHMARVLVRPPQGAFYATDSNCARTVARKNKAGQAPAQVIKRGAPPELSYLLRATSASKRGVTKRCGGLMEDCQSQDLRQFFGPLVGGEHYDIGTRRRHSDTNGNTTAGLTSFMFSRGVGEQLATVLDVLAEDSEQISLSSLKALGTLGAGGFGKVIKVVDVRTGAPYAMKLQRKDRTTEVALREAREMRGSRHAFVARLVRVFHTRSFYGLLMELCDKDLNRRILEGPTLPTAIPVGSPTASDSISRPAGKGAGIATFQAARYTTCILLALEYLHSKEVVFRDLKPENVLVTLPENGDYAKLTDFGLACTVDAMEKCSPRRRQSSPPGSDWFSASENVSSGDESARHSPHAVAFSGTPAFMPSDAYEGSCALEESREAKVARLAARDWYALGCCLILMLLGEGGGKKVSTGKRVVLLPLPEAELHMCLQRAANDPDVDQEALLLASALTAPLSLRAGAEGARRSPFLREALAELVPVAAQYGQREEVDTSSPRRLSGRSR